MVSNLNLQWKLTGFMHVFLSGNTIDAQTNGRQLKENQYVCDIRL